MAAQAPRAVASWKCPGCRRAFRRAKQPHSCAPAATLGSHFEGRGPGVERLARALLAALRSTRVPHEVEPVQTRILGRGKRVFLVLIPRRESLDGEILLPDPTAHPRLGRVLASGRFFAHRFSLPVGASLYPGFRRLLRIAALVGQA